MPSHAAIGGVLATVAVRLSTETGLLQPCALGPGPFASSCGSPSLAQQWDVGCALLLRAARPWRVGGTLLNASRLALQRKDFLVSVGHLPSRPEPSRFPTGCVGKNKFAVSKLDLAFCWESTVVRIAGFQSQGRRHCVSSSYTEGFGHPHSLQNLGHLMDNKPHNACLSTG